MQSPGNVTRLEYDGRELFLVGTAHVSRKSVDEVREVIAELRPDAVCVELDALRYESLRDQSRWRKLNVSQIIREGKVLYLLANLALSAHQRRIGDKLGVRPGAELLAAVEAAEAIGAELVLADRDIQATLKRAWSNVRFLDRAKLIAILLAAPFANEEITEEQLEALKERDTFSEMLDELARVMPGIREPLITERDSWLISSVREAPGKRIVAIVGAGHVPGMVRGLNEPVDRASLALIPQKKLTTKLLAWLLPLVIVVALCFGWSRPEHHSWSQLLLAWALPTSIGCGIGTALAGAHPLVVLLGALVAPVTTLHPAIAAGMLTSLAEAWLRRPTVADCEDIPQAVQSLGGFYRNRALRVFLILMASNIGATIGVAVGAARLLSLLR